MFFGITTALSPTSAICSCMRRPADREERAFIPESEYGKVVSGPRIHLLIYAGVIALSIYTGSILPLMFVGLPALYGGWLTSLQRYATCGSRRKRARPSAQLPDGPDERGHRFLYWNMNYHLEHHMFPLVPNHIWRGSTS